MPSAIRRRPGSPVRVSQLNQTTGAYPGSVRTRFSDRKPQTHSYAPLSPVLHFNAARGDMVGGNFWDMRATGRRLGNPAAEQAEGPPAVTSIKDHQDFRGTEKRHACERNEWWQSVLARWPRAHWCSESSPTCGRHAHSFILK